MIYIYNCYGGTHSSTMAAAVHLKKLPLDRVPTKEEILQTEYFNTLTYKDMGRIIYRGTDEENNKVYTIGRGTSKVLIPCLKNLIDIFQNECGLKEKIIMSNMSPTVSFHMTIGGFLSRGLNIDFIGVPLLVMGVRKNYHKVIDIVNNTKKTACSMKNNVEVLMNETST